MESKYVGRSRALIFLDLQSFPFALLAHIIGQRSLSNENIFETKVKIKKAIFSCVILLQIERRKILENCKVRTKRDTERKLRKVNFLLILLNWWPLFSDVTLFGCSAWEGPKMRNILSYVICLFLAFDLQAKIILVKYNK